MSRAVLCDGCGALVSIGSALTVDVVFPVLADGDSGESWSVEICKSCWDRPMGEVLEKACDGLNLKRDKGRK